MNNNELKHIFRDNRNALDLAIICLRDLRNSPVVISDEELAIKVVEELLQDMEFIVESVDYKEKEKEFGDLFYTYVLPTLLEKDLIKSHDNPGVTLLSYNSPFSNIDYYA